MITLTFSKPILEKLYENLLVAQKLGNIRLYRLAQALVLYCAHGPRAGVAKLGLSLQGFQNIRYLEGHFSAWHSANLPISK